MAWKEHDVAVYLAARYFRLAWIFQSIVLVLSVVIILFTVLYTQRCDNEDDASNEDGDANIDVDDDGCLQISMSSFQIEGAIFGLSLAMSFVLSLDAYFIPSSRALHLKSGAAELKSIIWLYRPPAGMRWCPLWFAVGSRQLVASLWPQP